MRTRVDEKDNGLDDMVDYEKLTVAELKDILLKKGLPFTGKKSVLIQRIVDSEKMTILGWIDKKVMDYFVLLIAIMFIATLLFDPNGIFGCCGLIVLFFMYNDGVKEEPTSATISTLVIVNQPVKPLKKKKKKPKKKGLDLSEI